MENTRCSLRGVVIFSIISAVSIIQGELKSDYQRYEVRHTMVNVISSRTKINTDQFLFLYVSIACEYAKND